MNANHQYHELLLNLQALNAQAVKCHGKAGALGLKKTTLWLNDIIFENGRKMNLLKTHIESNTVAVELEALDISAKIAASWEKMSPAGRDEVMKAFGLSLFSAKGELISMALSTLSEHDLYKTGDMDAPFSIRDDNDEVVLPQCRRCGKSEAELIDQPCVPPTNEGEQQ